MERKKKRCECKCERCVVRGRDVDGDGERVDRCVKPVMEQDGWDTPIYYIGYEPNQGMTNSIENVHASDLES